MFTHVHKTSGRAAVALVVLAVYVGAHFTLSARLVARDWGIRDAFIYVPIRPDTFTDYAPLFYVHHALRFFFYPAWKIDREVFGGPYPMLNMPFPNFGTTPEISNSKSAVDP